MRRDIEQPDAIVIGSGPCGITAARTLLEGGRSVLLADAGDYAPPIAVSGPLSALRRDRGEAWSFFLGRDLEALSATDESSPKLRAPRAARLIEKYVKALRITTTNFVAVGALAIGGLSNLWGASASFYSGVDLEGYPVRPDSMESRYPEIARRIGLSGCGDDDLAEYHGKVPLDGELPRPAPVEKVLARYRRTRAEQHASGFVLGRARNAVLVNPRAPARGGCSLDNLCLWGCPRGAIYSSAFELDDLARFPRFRLERNFMVKAISGSSDGWRIHGERNGAPLLLESRVLLLAAGAISSGRLVMDLKAWRDRPIRILTSPVFASAFLLPSLIGGRLPERGFAMAQLQYQLQETARPGDYAAGAIYLADGLPASELMRRLPLSRPAARSLVRAAMPAMMLATCYLSSDYSDNWATLRSDGDLAITGGHTAQASERVPQLSSRLRSAMRRLGLLAAPAPVTLSTPGSDFRYAGTVPMGGTGAMATTPLGEVVDARGLYVVDTASLPRLTAKPPILTAMANASRIAEGILRPPIA